MKNKLVSMFLATVISITFTVSAFAEDVTTAGSAGEVPVPLTAEAATFSVTVPTQLPLSIAADGTVTTATDAKIINNSFGAVKVTGISVEGLDGWVTVDYDSAKMSSEKVGAKKIALQINGDKTTGADAISFTATNFPKMDGTNETASDELGLTYSAKVPAQATALTDVSIANVIFTVAWDE